MRLLWDAGNIDHIARHGIAPAELEQVIANSPLDVMRYTRNGEERLNQVGETDTGRVLVVVTTERGRDTRVVTAHPGRSPDAGFLHAILFDRETRGRWQVTDLPKAPDLSNEQDEAAWWDSPEGRAFVLAGFRQAAEDGSLGRGTLAKRIGLTPTTTIRLDPADIALARSQAQKRGLKYQTYLKAIIHEALRQEAGR